ncbi:MAG: ribosome maturation factor RimP [Bacillota bacterium]
MIFLGKIADKVSEFVLPIAHSEKLDLVDVEYLKEGSNWVLRVFLENSRGDLTIEQCERVSRALGNILDEEDPIPDSYILEVSSPGLERPLKDKNDYKRFAGEYIYVKTYKNINNKKEFTGILNSSDDEKIQLKLKNGKTIDIDYSLIAKANLTVEI